MIKRRLLLSAACLSLLLGCSNLPALPAGQPPPKLVVLLVVDGLPMRQALSYREQLQPDGFRRFLDRGSWFSNAHYGHGHTVTAAGHAVMLSGAYPQRSGIISNEWRDPQTGQAVYCTGDADYQYIDHKTAPLAGTSPRNLRVETLGDVLRSQDAASKVLAISGKDRGAILPAGHKGKAYMYMSESGQFASSTYYMPAHPQWVKDFNQAKPADAYFGKTWAPLLAEVAYAQSVPDGQPWQVNSGNGNRLPAVIGAKHDKPGPLYYAGLMATPFSDELTFSFARAAIEGEGLGVDSKTDILSVSLSGHDYVNHAFGPESRLSHDHFLHLDVALQSFFSYLDQRIGAGNYVVALTSDHGFADTPEWARSKGLDVGRVNPTQLLGWVNDGLVKKFGAGRWALNFSAAGLLFDQQLIAARGASPADVYRETKSLLLQLDGIADVFTLEQLQGSDVSTAYLGVMRKSWHPEIAAPVQIVIKPGWLFGSRSGGSSHGTPYEYDTHVPLLFWGQGRVGQGEQRQRVEIADLAPTLAQIIGIPAPAQSQGKVLPLN